MGGRYLALLGHDHDRRRLLARRALIAGLVEVRETAQLLILTEPGMTLIDLGDVGVLIGDLFRAAGATRQEAMDPSACNQVRRSRGQHLIDTCWGGYVAFLDNGPTGIVDVVRAPLGALPCLHTSRAGITAVASDVALLAMTGLATPCVDWTALALHLKAGELRHRATCLADIYEVRGGERLRATGGISTTDILWSPWCFTGQDQRIDDPVEAACQVRDMTRSCVGARVPNRALVLLSGGLDSSIVAASLAHAEREFTCLNVVTANPTGDERREARQVADRLARPLLERFRRIAHVDLTRSSAAALPRPVARSFEQDSRAIADAVAREIGASIVIDGGGGDNVFCSLQSAAPVADCLIGRRGAGFWKTAREIGRLAETDLWTVAWRGWARSRRRDRGYRWRADRRFLSATMIEAGGDGADHPWLEAPEEALPGKAAHIAILAAAQGLAEDGDLQGSCSVLVAQPLIETCVRIPSWMWFDRGCNRAVARHAFAPELPTDIAWRRTKGTPDSFVVELFEANRPLIATLLLDGTLAAHGLLEVAAVATALDDARPTMGHDYVRLMQLVDAEVWARGW